MPTLDEIARFTEAELVGNGALEITGIASLESAGRNDLAGVDNVSYLEKAAASKAGAFLIFSTVVRADLDRPALLAKFPLSTLNTVIERMGLVPPPPPVHMHETAIIETDLGPDCSVGPYAVIAKGAQIGARCRIGAHVVIEGDVVMGEDCWISHGAVLHDGSRLGNRVRIAAHVVLSRQGFGYAASEHGPVALHHIGTVVLEDDVHVGASTTIDRARYDETRVGRLTALDNLIQVGHNAQIGERSFVAAQSGLAGCARIGDDCEVGGQVGLSNRAVLGDRCRVSAKSGVFGNVPADARYLGYPALPSKEALKMVATLRRLARKS